MATHLRDVVDDRGELVDVHYFCSAGCWSDSFAPDRIGPACPGGAGGLTVGGAAPCAAAEPGECRDVHCAECGVLLASPDKDPPAVVNLIARPPLDPLTGAAVPVAS